jgi:pyruvate/2-oxoacid:ferredoxin oxidoreductase alpha subunit
MTMKNFETMDGNEVVAWVAFQLNDVVSLFPITPASPMGEWADAWAAVGVKNLWGTEEREGRNECRHGMIWRASLRISRSQQSRSLR